MAKSVRLCRTEPAIFKEDIIMSKIVNEAKISHLRSGLLPLLPDIHCLHRRRFSAWPSRLSCSEDAAGWSACDRHSSTPSAFLTQGSIAQFQPLAFGGLAKQHARTAAQVQTVRACFTLSERANASSLRSGNAQVIPVEDKRRRLNRWLGK